MTANAETPRANWTYPTTIRFGAGRIAELAEACGAAGIARPLLVTDPGLAGLSMVTGTLEALAESGLPAGLFSELRPNPIEQNVADGVAVFRDGGHDGVVAFGGGSALDTGKAIAFMAGQTRPIWDFEDIGDYWTRADGDAIAPVIAVPTTAGTGSEVGRAAVILNEETHKKVIVFHPKMLPVIVISDPALTVGLPPNITAATGMDALAHNLEAFCAPGYHPMADGIAVEGIRLIKKSLARAVGSGGDVAARGDMLIAASMGATAFQKGLGAIHSLSHPVGALYDTHHGLTNGVFMPYVMAFNRAAIDGRMTRLAAYLQLPDPSFDSVLAWVLELRTEIGIPHQLHELGVGDDRVDEIAAMAATDPTAPTNPVPLDTAALKSIFSDALGGHLS